MNVSTSGKHSFHVSRVGVYATVAAGETQPEWIELVPAGQFSGRDGRGPYYLEHPDAVIAATRALQMEAGLPIDYDHATDLAAPQGQPAPAAGWIKELAVRSGALWGRVEWTGHGAEAIATREYRYVSPVFEHDAEGVVLRLLRAALTNNPNLYLKAIASSVTTHATMERIEGEDAGAESATPGRPAAGVEALRNALGLEAAATGAEILEAARRLVEQSEGGAATGGGAARAAETVEAGGAAERLDRSRYVAIEHFAKAARELSQLRAERRRENGERAVEAAMRAGKIVPAQREWAIEYCSADPRGFDEFVARQPAMRLGELDLASEPRRRGIGKGDLSGLGASSPVETLDPIETAICARLGLRSSDYARRKAARPLLGDTIV